MMRRRSFIKNSGMAVLGSLAFPEVAHAFTRNPGHLIGVQLFTFFNTIDADVKGTLKKIAQMGYREVESAFSKQAGYYGLKPKEFAALCKNEGLLWKSHHVLGAPFKLPPGAKMPVGADGKPIVIPAMKNLRDNMQQLVDEAAEGGVPYLVCSSTPVATPDEINSSIAVLIKTGEACKKAGIQLCYHNHDMEFKEVDGKIPYQMLLEDTPAEAVKMELDLAWVTKAGVDPVALFEKHPGRFPLLHVKDISSDFKTLEPVGMGVVDFKRIFAHLKLSGAKHYFVEHDMPADAFASTKQSFSALRKLGI